MRYYKLNQEEKKFAEDLKKGYHVRSVIKKITNYKFFEPEMKITDEFIQITDSIMMESSDFDGRVDNSFLAGDIGRSIAYGEINYLTEKLKEKVDSIVNKDILDLNSLREELKKLPTDFKPIALLIPIEEKYFMKFYEEFGKHGAIIYDKSKLKIDDLILDVYWSNRYTPFQEIYLLGENAVDWVVKSADQMKTPIHSEIKFESILDSDKEIDVFYGVDKDQKIHFGCRVVVSPKINIQFVRIFKS